MVRSNAGMDVKDHNPTGMCSLATVLMIYTTNRDVEALKAYSIHFDPRCELTEWLDRLQEKARLKSCLPSYWTSIKWTEKITTD